MKIFIDIETIPTGEMPQLSELKPPAQMTKADTIQKWMDDTEARGADLDKIYRKRALDYMQGQVLCIGYAIEDGPVAGIINDDEETLFKQLEANLMENKTIESMFRQGSPVVWISYNGRAFDYPYLSLRAAKYGCKFLAMALRPFNEREQALASYATQLEAANAEARAWAIEQNQQQGYPVTAEDAEWLQQYRSR